MGGDFLIPQTEPPGVDLELWVEVILVEGWAEQMPEVVEVAVLEVDLLEQAGGLMAETRAGEMEAREDLGVAVEGAFWVVHLVLLEAQEDSAEGVVEQEEEAAEVVVTEGSEAGGAPLHKIGKRAMEDLVAAAGDSGTLQRGPRAMEE
jgi:hypothetical protein